MLIGLDDYYPSDTKSVDASSADVDLTTTFAYQVYCRGVWNGSSSAADIKVTTAGGNAVVFKNVPPGTAVTGVFTLLWHTGTTATNLLALK